MGGESASHAPRADELRLHPRDGGKNAAGGGEGDELRVDHLRERDRAVAELARRQKGVVARRQLLQLGVSPRTIDTWLGSSRLHLLHRGVYLLGHASPPTGAQEMAAILACGSRSAISHASAAALLAISQRQPEIVEVTVVARRPPNRPGIRVHQTTFLQPGRDVRTRDGIPVTSPARTILDLAARLPIGELERMVAEAQVLRLVRRRELVEQLELHPRRRGTRALRTLLEAEDRPARTRSRAERKLLRLVRSARLLSPQVNAKVGPYEVDLLWRDANLVVEFDSWMAHSNRRAFEADRSRDADLQTRGFRVIRVTWRQLEREPERLLARIAAALALGDSQARG
jgi:very-short-patch-repair endonuclease